MDEASTNPEDELGAGAPETPEDVAVLYTWANVHGGKYRDFSAARREFRAQQRHRMVEAQRAAELEAARAKEEAAASELEDARRRERESADDAHAREQAEEARRHAEERAEQDRQAAQRHVETAEELKRTMEQARREMEEAHARADEQAARWREADARLRATQGEGNPIPGEIQDPYYFAGPLEPTAFAPGKGVRSSVPQRVSSERRLVETYFRNREETRGSEPARGAPGDDSGFGIFSSGRLDSESSSARAVYHDRVYSQRAPDRTPGKYVESRQEAHMEGRSETPEDTRERQRVDERERSSLAHGEARFDANAGDAYYDRMPQSWGADSEAARNTAAGDLHIPPRREQGRPSSMSSAERRVITRSEDPQPGNTHLLDNVRPRRRESAADATARTARRPRFSEQQRQSEGFGERARRIGGSGEVAAYSAGDGHEESIFTPPAEREALRPSDVSPQRTDLREQPPSAGRDTWYEAKREGEQELKTQRGQERHADAGREVRTEPRHEQPEWLVRNAPIPGEPPLPSHTPLTPAADYASEVQRGRSREETSAAPRTRDSQAVRADWRDSAVQSARPEAPSQRAETSPRRPQPSSEGEPPHLREDRPERRRYERRTGDSQADLDPFESSSGRPAYLSPATLARADSRGLETVVHSGTERLRNPAEVRPSTVQALNEADRSGGFAASRGASATVSAGRLAPPADTLQQSRERVAARWFALKGLMGPGSESSPEGAAPARERETSVPTLCVVSLSGGVGKTSLVATLGRALSSVGEKVLLADTSAHGLLPYYFGARELRPDVVRTFSPPPGSTDAPVHMVNYETDRLNADDAGQARLVEEIGRHSRGAQRTLLDLSGSSAWLARRLAKQSSHILVPIAPDMNSVLSIQAVERFFAGVTDAEGTTVQPFYVLNQFDASLPLHLDVREVVRQQLGDRLLAIMIRRSPSVAEALAEGMTVIDYAPEAPVTEDYIHLSQWVRHLAAPALSGLRSIRWSER